VVVTIEWRRIPDKTHTGSAELLGGFGSPFVYLHPQDHGRDLLTGTKNGLASCAGMWHYTHNDTIESPFAGNVGEIIVQGRMSYADYHASRRLEKSG